MNLDRARAAEFYRRSLGISPDGRNATTAAWRLAWTAYLDWKPEAADMLESYVRQFPNSSYIQDDFDPALAAPTSVPATSIAHGIFIWLAPIGFR